MSHPLVKKWLPPALGLAGLWLGMRYLFPIVMPFLLGLALALAADPLVKTFRNRLRLPQWLASFLGVSLSLVLAAAVTATVCAFALRQVGQLARIVPDLEGTALQGMNALQNFFLGLSAQVPQGLQPILEHSVRDLFSGGTQLVDRASDAVVQLADRVVTRLPDSALTVGTWLLAAFMFSARLPRLKAWLAARLPEKWRANYLPGLQQLRKTLLGWLMAQLKLTAVTFGILCLGLLLLRIPHGILWAAVISLLDALPVLGTGTVLVPWALVCFLQADHVTALGLLGTYTAAAVTRSVLEPRLVGKELGLDPLVTLAAMYTGFRLWGLAGLILAPMATMLAAQLFFSASDR